MLSPGQKVAQLAEIEAPTPSPQCNLRTPEHDPGEAGSPSTDMGRSRFLDVLGGPLQQRYVQGQRPFLQMMFSGGSAAVLIFKFIYFYLAASVLGAAHEIFLHHTGSFLAAHGLSLVVVGGLSSCRHAGSLVVTHRLQCGGLVATQHVGS